jgi:histo-blood group ABO system transferase
VRRREGAHYFAGGFYGGKKDQFLRLIETTSANINKDLAHDFIALWHDESHLNRYFIDQRPTIALDPSYCYPERWDLPFSKRLLALDKNHDKMRE